METSDVRRRVNEVIERSKRKATERRVRSDEASAEWAAFLDNVAVPLFRQVANVLKALSYSFTVFTPGGSVRLMSDKNGDDYVELLLDTSGDEVAVIGHSSKRHGGRVIESEVALATGPIRDVPEETVIQFVLAELEPFVER